MGLENLRKDGFFVKDERSSLSNISTISLRNSLQAYSRTYSSIIGHLNDAIKSNSRKIEIDDDIPGYHYSVLYINYACTAITNFHHFCKLIIKDILVEIHPLLAVDTSNKHLLLFKLLQKEEVSPEEIDGLQHIEFTKAHNRLQNLIAEKKIPEKYSFFRKYKDFLDTINTLRNRIIHRGVFVLHYKSLDELFTKHAIPFLRDILMLDAYSKNRLWRPKHIHLDFDPIHELSLAWPEEENYPFEKIAFLKELIRAAYELPGELKFNSKTRKYNSLFSSHEAKRIEQAAISFATENFENIIEVCPVCSFKSLVVFEDYYEYEHGETGHTVQQPFFYRAKCTYCSFEITPEIGPLAKFGLPITDFWNRDHY